MSRSPKAQWLRHRDESRARDPLELREIPRQPLGEVVKRFSPDTAPDAPELVAAIEAELQELKRRSQLEWSRRPRRRSAERWFVRSLADSVSEEEEPEDSPASRLASHHDLRVMLVEDALRYPQAQAGSRIALRRHKWVEESMKRRAADSFSVSATVTLTPLRPSRSVAGRTATISRPFCGSASSALPIRFVITC